MNCNKLLIDYVPGSHGRFLEYVINKFILRSPYCNFNPFLPNGSSHNIPDEYTHNIETKSGHFSYFVAQDQTDVDLTTMSMFPGSKCIRINTDMLYQVQYNMLTTVSNRNLDLDTIHIDTENKFKASGLPDHFEILKKRFGPKLVYTKKEVSYLMLYILNSLDLPFTEWINVQEVDDFCTVNMSSFFDWNLFLNEIVKISKFIEVPVDISNFPSLRSLWKTFIFKNKAHQSYTKIEKFLQDNHSDNYKHVNYNCFEQAYIAYYFKNTRHIENYDIQSR